MSFNRSNRDTNTPVPTVDLLNITQVVTTTKSEIRAINRLLPEIAKDARKTSDGLIKIATWSEDVTRRITNLENDKDEQENKLDASNSLIAENAKFITSQEKEISGLSKWRTYLLSILIPIALTIGGVIGKAIYDVAQIENTAIENRKDISENLKQLKGIEKSRREDRDEIISAVRNVPYAVDKMSLDREMTIEDAKSRMTYRQKRILTKLLREIKRRE
jgi:septal ring factor EnvC (AmiA/AmiB activator)